MTTGSGGRSRRILLVGLAPEVAEWLASDLLDVQCQRAESEAEALRLLVAGGFAVALIAARLQDGSGESLLHQVRDRTHLADTPVLFCLDAETDRDAGRRVVSLLGVAQLLIQPLDRDELLRQVVRLCPDLAPPAQRGGGRTAGVQIGIAALWEKYHPSISARVDAMEAAVVELLQGALRVETRRKAEREAHKLAGSVGTFGFMRASLLARELEEILAGAEPLSPDRALRLSDGVVALRAELERPAPSGAGTPSPSQAEGRSVLVYDAEPGFAHRVMDELAAADLHGQVVTTVPEVRRALAAGAPAAAIVDLAAEPSIQGGRLALQALSALDPPVPTVVLLSDDSLRDRVEAASLGARAFLQKPITASRLVEETQAMLQRARPQRARILAVDDDPQLLHTLRTTLGPSDWEVHTLEDPLSFWSVLETVRPDLLMLDVDMPHLSGVELCRVVRRDPRWEGLPVLFLTARTDAEVVHRVFAAGADDFVAKPIVGPELVTRIANRLERAQLFRTIAETDYLTGIPNRRKASELMDQLRRLALRHRQPFCLAIIDLDRFKEINDSHGHPAGDRVLVRLAERLLATFRGADVVGRWGGEEFVLGMYGMNRVDGVARLQHTLERFREERFPSADGEGFTASFSGGVAEAPPDGAELGVLYQAADSALYRAKHLGRSRICAAGEPEVVGALRLGAVDQVAKPFSIPVLMERVRRILDF